MTKDFTGYVLAGGKSSRMQKDKAFLEIAGETFLSRAVRTLSDNGENQVKIVLNRTQSDFIERLPPNVAHIFDVYENRGALGGIHAALTDCQTKYAIILAVDLPLVSSAAIEKLAAIALASNKFIATVPRQTDGRLQPLCAVYHARYCLPPLENLMGENDSASVGDFLELVQPRIIDQAKIDASPDALFNVNRPADFERLG